MTTDAHFLKIARARRQVEELEHAVQRWLDEKHYTVTTKADPEPRYYVVIASAEPIPLDPFAILIGEVLQGLRSGLDHIAYKLASSFTVPLPQDIAEHSEFPIFGDVDRKGNAGSGARLFQGGGIAKIRGIHPSAQTIIEGLQPYHRGNQFASDPLWRLHELSRIDKHRLLHPVAYHFSGALLNPRSIFNVTIGPGIIKVNQGAIENDTVIVRYPAQPIFKSVPMKVHFEPAIGIAFPDGSVAAGEKVVDALVDIYNHIARNVIPPLNPYL